MQIFSCSHTIVALASARVFAEGAKLPDNMMLHHPAGTVLEIEDEEAQRFIDDGLAERYIRSEHGENQRDLIANAGRRRGEAATRAAEAKQAVVA